MGSGQASGGDPHCCSCSPHWGRVAFVGGSGDNVLAVRYAPSGEIIRPSLTTALQACERVMVITLVGVRGTGKSTVAREIARRLKWEVVDADEEIELRAGRSIRTIFEESGEPAFRQLELEVMRDLLERENLVVASGGGAVLDPFTRQRMIAAGPVIWLQAEPQTIVARLSADASTTERRPALTEQDPIEEIHSVLKEREPLYHEVATRIVETDGRSVSEIVDEILDRDPVGEEPYA